MKLWTSVHSISSPINRNIKVYSGGFDTVKDADVIICDAGPSILPGQYERLKLAKENVKNITEIMTEVVKYNTRCYLYYDRQSFRCYNLFSSYQVSFGNTVDYSVPVQP